MSNRADAIKQKLIDKLAPESIDIIDQSHLHAGHEGAKSGGGHFDLTIVGDCFSGLNTVARHRLIYQTLSEEMQGEIHALSIKAFSPEEI